MAAVDLGCVPEEHRDAVASAVTASFGSGDDVTLAPIGGGASGALTFRVRRPAGDHFLRVETIRGPLRNPHQYTCMRSAAEAGIAPPIRHLDEDAGVLVLPFIAQRPLERHPGGPSAVASEVGALIARLQATDTFPSFGDYVDNLGRMVDHVRSVRCAPGLLDRHAEGFARIRSVCPWDPTTFVSAHNDPNPLNLLYDGERLWLVDWETASRNDPLVDVAVTCQHAAPTPELEEVLLRSWLGREPDPVLRARLELVKLLTRLWVGSILLMLVVDPDVPVHTGLAAPSVDELPAMVARGELTPGAPATTVVVAKTMLAAFLDGITSPRFEAAVRVVAAG